MMLSSRGQPREDEQPVQSAGLDHLDSTSVDALVARLRTAQREAVVNALVHRDLSASARGTQVQVEMYPDRLVIRNPGGLFGLVMVDNLGEEGISSARNATLIKILEGVPLPGETPHRLRKPQVGHPCHARLAAWAAFGDHEQPRDTAAAGSMTSSRWLVT
jgi:ATP-dependent DNA helicase recG-like protein